MKHLEKHLLTALLLGAGVVWAASPPRAGQPSQRTSGPSWTIQTGSTKLNHDGVSALWLLHQVSQLEIHAGALAQTNSPDPDVRKDGQTLVNDYQALDQQVKSFAKKNHIQLEGPGVGGSGQAGKQGTGGSGQPQSHPATVTIAGPEAQLVQDARSAQDRLRGTSGQSFDPSWLSNQIQVQGRAILLLNNRIAQIDDGDLRSLVQDGLAKMNQHQQAAQKRLRAVEAKNAKGK